MKKSFLEFMSLCEAVYDKDVMGRSQIKKTGEGGRIAPKRKQTDAEKRRMKAVGGGKMAPAKTYKDRKDIGQSNVKRSPAGREQQPTQERGSARLDPREAQRKAARESTIVQEAEERDAKIKSCMEKGSHRNNFERIPRIKGYQTNQKELQKKHYSKHQEF